jgi:hypothetical protein
MKYTSLFIADNMFEISTIFNEEPIKFFVVVASSDKELDGLVAFHLNHLATPYKPPIPLPTPERTLEAIQSQIFDLQAQVTSLMDSQSSL